MSAALHWDASATNPCLCAVNGISKKHAVRKSCVSPRPDLVCIDSRHLNGNSDEAIGLFETVFSKNNNLLENISILWKRFDKKKCYCSANLATVNCWSLNQISRPLVQISFWLWNKVSNPKQTIHPIPNRPFHNFRASKSIDRRFRTTLSWSIYGF